MFLKSDMSTTVLLMIGKQNIPERQRVTKLKVSRGRDILVAADQLFC